MIAKEETKARAHSLHPVWFKPRNAPQNTLGKKNSGTLGIHQRMIQTLNPAKDR